MKKFFFYFILLFLLCSGSSYGNNKVHINTDSPASLYFDITVSGINRIEFPYLKNVTIRQRQISGKVLDEDGNPITGASIVEGGTQNGATTDSLGNFSITITGNSALQVSSSGYLPQEINTAGKDEFTIIMKKDLLHLDEIVLIGYGTAKKRDLTGAVVSVNSSQITSVPTTSVTEALQGQVAGLNVTNSSFSPGSKPNILIRGKRSVNASNDPLYVVDGVPITGGIEEISPLDIASIEVLKDASATAIYGSRGANGVILITTKTGKSGNTITEYNSYTGPQTILKQLNLWDGAGYAELTREAYRNSTNPNNRYHSDVPDKQEDLVNPAFNRDPTMMAAVMKGWTTDDTYDPSLVPTPGDYRPFVTRTGLLTNHQLSVYGGGKSTNFLVSGTYNKNDGIYKDEAYERYTFRLNLSQTISKYVRIETQTQFSHARQDRGSGFANDYRVPPLGALRDSLGNIIPLPGSEITYNPLLDLVPGAVDDPLKTTHFLGSYALNINLPIEGLRFRSGLGIDSRTLQDYDFRSGHSTARQMGTSFAKNAGDKFTMFSLENLLSYNKVFSENHRVDVSLLQSVQSNQEESYNVQVEDLPSDDLKYYDIGLAQRVLSRSSGLTEWKMASFMARINYSYLNKYFFTVSARDDGASPLAIEHKWTMFPSAAFAWQMGDENFMKNIDWLSNLKLRLGYGKTGNSSIVPYQTKGGLKVMSYSFSNGANNLFGYAPDIMANSSLGWETTDQLNLGIDFGLLQGRLSGSIDWYVQSTHNLLLSRQLPVVSGFSSVLSNVGRTRNKGIEISLNTANIIKKDFKWNTSLVFSSNREEFTELYEGKSEDIGNAWFIGQPVDVFYDYKKIGIWQNTAEDKKEMDKFNENGGTFSPGDIKIEDINGDYKITEADRQILGNPRPKAIFSIENNLHYKSFDFNLSIYSSVGAMIYNPIDAMEHVGRNGGAVFDYWTPNNPTNAFPRPNVDEERPLYITSAYYENASYLRVRAITIGYSFPKIQPFQTLRIYFAVKNPFLLTSFSGVDPESIRDGGYTTPSLTSWLLGVNVKI